MSNQSFAQFAGQPAPGPAPAPGYAQPGTPQGFPQGAPPPGFAPQGAPPAQAPAWPNQGPPVGAPPAPGAPVFAPPVQQQYAPAQAPAPQAVQYAPAPGQPPVQVGVPFQMQAQPAPQYAPTPAAAPAFGAGAFGAAKIMGDKLPCAPGLYRMRVQETGQRRDPKTQLPYWRLKATVVGILAQGSQQPQGSDVTTSQGLTGDQQVQYAGSFFLQLGAACFGCNNETELKAALNQRYGAFQLPDGRVLDGWAQFADALQNATQQVNNCPPNPLAGCEFIVEVVPQQGTGKNANKVFEKWQGLRRVPPANTPGQ